MYIRYVRIRLVAVKLFSWLRQKVNKKIDAYGHDAKTPARTCLQDDAVSRQDTLTPFSILIKFDVTEYSYSKFQGYSSHLYSKHNTVPLQANTYKHITLTLQENSCNHITVTNKLLNACHSTITSKLLQNLRLQ